jgi:PAS domain S-box-containing protein
VYDRPRNIENKANDRQMETIEYFKKNRSKEFLFKEENETFFYAQPLYISANCLNCHGKKEDAPQYIQTHYARAYDYKLGDLRGIIEIEIKETAVTKRLDSTYMMNILFLSIFFTLLLLLAFFYAKSSKNMMLTIRKKEKKIHLQAFEQREYLDTVIESSNNAIIALNQDFDMLTYNKKAELLFGYRKDEMLGKESIFMLIPSKYHKLFKEESQEYFKKGALGKKLLNTIELKGIHKNRKIFPIQVCLGMNTERKNSIMIINVLDLSIEEELRKTSKNTQKELENLIQHFGENVLASQVDTSGKITYVSEALCQTSGYSKEEILGKTHNIFRHEDMTYEFFKEMWQVISKKKKWEGEIKNRKKDGSYFWVHSAIIPTLDKDGKIISYDAITHDITPEKIKDEFMANMSHELRTPLNSIIGFSSILSQELKNPHQRNLSQRINNNSELLLQLISDILDLSKIQTTAFSIEAHDFNAYDAFTLSIDNLQGLMTEKNLNFHIDIHKNLNAIFSADSLRITQVIFNFISNSIKFTHEYGDIYYTAKYNEEEGNLDFSIRDTGIGMNQATQEKIFKPFVQADGSTTRKYGGTGLGLSINETLISLMEGKIELFSEEGKGTEIICHIPLKRSDKKVEISTVVKKKKKKAKFDAHILIVDDQEMNRMLLGLFLKGFGITFDSASTGVEAVSMYKVNTHTLILMDENMPEMNGTEAMQILKEKYKEECCPIVVLTANAMKGAKERFLELGMDEYLSKPINEDKLESVLKRFLV